ncbi:hypothetical protein J7390_20220, partial [Xanthomonas phaseoli pv. manihotis]|uniref:hypothetical protein n=1 Tax=Xanthomonas phaseoli TaxID=1985254 RepID=UPI001ADC7262
MCNLQAAPTRSEVQRLLSTCNCRQWCACRAAADARQRKQRIEVARHLPGVQRDALLGGGMQIARAGV